MKTNLDILAVQISTCVGTISNLTGCLRRIEGAEGLSNRVTAAMESSAITACKRLDALLMNDAAWSLPTMDSHELGLSAAIFTNRVMAHNDWVLNARREAAQPAPKQDIFIEEIPPQQTRRQQRRKKK